MSTKVAKRFSVKTDVSVFKRLGNGNQEQIAQNHQVKTGVCKYWLQGRCNRNLCRFLHSDRPNPHTLKSKYAWKNPDTKSKTSPPIEKIRPNVSKDKVNCGQNLSGPKTQQELLTKEENHSKSKSIHNNHKLLTNEENDSESKSIQKKQKLCNYWLTENCLKGKNCENLHSWFSGNGLSMVTRLEGHTKAVTGIVYTRGFNTLSCGSKDKSLRVWDCNSGQCVDEVNLDDEFGTLVNEGPWIFAGLTDTIKAWNLETQNEVYIQASGGQVNAITMFEDILFAGMEYGSILSWKSTSEKSFSEVATSLKGHNGSVLSLIVGAKKLFSGSADYTIRVWNPESLECMQVLNGHTGDVTSVLCWSEYLLSGSLDKKIKVWATSESGNIDEVYEHNLDDGVVALCGMSDAEAKPILLCSGKDNGVGLYDLPSFVERGRVFSRRDIQAIQIGPGGLFFTGDEAGLVSVWKLNVESSNKSC